jgi:hypothetical protein
MKVKDLISELQKYDGELDISIFDLRGDGYKIREIGEEHFYKNSTIPIDQIYIELENL